MVRRDAHPEQIMDVASLLVFGGALLVAAASPGPAVAAIVARVLGRGTRGAFSFILGIAIGDVVWLGLTVLGLSALAQTFQGVFLVVRYLGAAYLLWLAWKLWTAPVSVEIAPAQPADDRNRLFLAGLALTVGNPKAMLFYIALVPALIEVAQISLLGFAELALVILLVLGTVFTSYILLAARVRRLFASPRALRAINRGSGTIMAGAAAAIVAR